MGASNLLIPPWCHPRRCWAFSSLQHRLEGGHKAFGLIRESFLEGRLEEPEYSSKQPSDPVVPLVPCTGIFLGPSKSGKTVALISLILEQYRGVFERIYVFSPSVNIDDGWIPVKKYIEGDLGVNTEREQTYWDEWDEAALRRIIQQQRKITEASKKLEMKKLYQVLVVIDDFADTPQLHKPHGALDTLFIRGRHMQISTWVSSQKLRLISAAVRVNMQFLCRWRLRNQHELDAVIEELSALLPKEQLYPSCSSRTRPTSSTLRGTGWSAPRARATRNSRTEVETLLRQRMRGLRSVSFQLPCKEDVLPSAFEDKPLCGSWPSCCS